MRRALVLAALLAAPLALASASLPETKSDADPREASLVLLTDPAAKCMDGTPAGYYFQVRPASLDRCTWLYQPPWR